MGKKETELFIKEYLMELGIPRKVAGFQYLNYCLVEMLEHPHHSLTEILEQMNQECKLRSNWNNCYSRCLYALKNSTNHNIRTMTLQNFLCFALDEINHRLLEELKKN